MALFEGNTQRSKGTKVKIVTESQRRIAEVRQAMNNKKLILTVKERHLHDKFYALTTELDRIEAHYQHTALWTSAMGQREKELLTAQVLCARKVLRAKENKPNLDEVHQEAREIVLNDIVELSREAVKEYGPLKRNRSKQKVVNDNDKGKPEVEDTVDEEVISRAPWMESIIQNRDTERARLQVQTENDIMTATGIEFEEAKK